MYYIQFFEIAFDKIPHRRLMSKLRSYRVNTDIILWVMAFLMIGGNVWLL